MHSTRLSSVLIVAACMSMMVTSSVPSAADPKPLPVKPAPADDKKDKPKPVTFPMSSADFRPFLDKIITALQAQAAGAEQAGEHPPAGFADRMRFRGSQAMEDGTVTQTEFEYVMEAAD